MNLVSNNLIFSPTLELKFLKTFIFNLSPYDLERNLLVYVSTTLSSLGEMLTQQEDEGKERAIYYIRKTFIDYEMRYTPIEKMYFVIIFATKKLRYYMLGNTTYIIAFFYPLRYI